MSEPVLCVYDFRHVGAAALHDVVALKDTLIFVEGWSVTFAYYANNTTADDDAVGVLQRRTAVSTIRPHSGGGFIGLAVPFPPPIQEEYERRAHPFRLVALHTTARPLSTDSTLRLSTVYALQLPVSDTAPPYAAEESPGADTALDRHVAELCLWMDQVAIPSGYTDWLRRLTISVPLRPVAAVVGSHDELHEHEWYFSYGSNMCLRQTVIRIGPPLERVGAVLNGWSLVFNKPSKADSRIAYANIAPSGDGQVCGVAMRLHKSQLQVMDRFEGGYERRHVTVDRLDNQASLVCAVYLATGDLSDNGGGRPTAMYMLRLLGGSDVLPPSYTEKLKALPLSEVEVPRAQLKRAGRL